MGRQVLSIPAWVTKDQILHYANRFNLVSNKFEILIAMDKLSNARCSACGKKQTKTYCCSKCKGIRYCGRECQLAHIKQHKKRCVAFDSKKDQKPNLTPSQILKALSKESLSPGSKGIGLFFYRCYFAAGSDAIGRYMLDFIGPSLKQQLIDDCGMESLFIIESSVPRWKLSTMFYNTDAFKKKFVFTPPPMSRLTTMDQYQQNMNQRYAVLALTHGYDTEKQKYKEGNVVGIGRAPSCSIDGITHDPNGGQTSIPDAPIVDLSPLIDKTMKEVKVWEPGNRCMDKEEEHKNIAKAKGFHSLSELFVKDPSASNTASPENKKDMEKLNDHKERLEVLFSDPSFEPPETLAELKELMKGAK